MPAVSRVELLRQELEALGLAEEAADALACEAVVHHPLVQQLGVDRLAGRLANEGIEADAARQAAWTLLAFEHLGAGRDFADVQRVLESQGADAGTAHGACLDAARLRRSCRTATSPTHPSRDAWIACALVFGLALVLAWLGPWAAG
ncbi:MAG: hypothetical protein MJE66_07475 [Proteobacteria bacterium]|nr:hypothetical protein [Pseudomonadota bacterium]